jgi:lysozyme family protein
MTRDEAATAAINSILAKEGGFVDHPADRGGPTKYGITAGTLAGWRKLDRPATRDEIEDLEEEEARAIYRSEYIDRPGFSAIENPTLFLAVVDVAVNHGPTRAARFLQHALEVRVDGIVGRFTLDALQRADVGTIYRRFVAERAREYGRIITMDRSQNVFAAGWMNRLATFIELSA